MDDVKKLKRAIKAKCMDCSGGDQAEVALCQVQDCPLYPYRMELRASLLDPPADEPEEDNGKSDAKPNSGQFSLI